MVDFVTIIIVAVVAIVVGIIISAIVILTKLFLVDRKSRKQWREKKKIFTDKFQVPIKVVDKGDIQKPLPESPQVTSEMKEERPYKEDFKLFKEANKEMEKLKESHNKGDISYTELKERFEFLQNQPYYRRILEDYEK